nr:site-specific tyrosine recombinase/integron integrase [Clostridium sp. Marseille-P7770]
MMTTEIRNRVMVELGDTFTVEELHMIDLAVAKALQGVRIEKEETLPMLVDSSQSMFVREFMARKRIKGCRPRTIEAYEGLLKEFSGWADAARRPLDQVKDIDILIYLDWVKTKNKVSDRTLENKRLILSSFYAFMHDTGKMAWNPTRTVDPVKYAAKVRHPLTDMELEKVRNTCETPREHALFEVLYSTGCRVSELVQINISDIDFQKRSLVVIGKGNKERYVFLNAKAIYAIQKYMNSRDDDNPALFVWNNKPHNRCSKAAVETVIRDLGKRSGIGRPLFPHLLRHTFATDLLAHGAKIYEVSQMLGHAQIETTKIYAKLGSNALSNAHAQYLA